MRSGVRARSRPFRSRISLTGWNPIAASGSRNLRPWTATSMSYSRRRSDVLEKLRVSAEPAKPTIVMTRIFDAPRAVVFDAWTKAEHVAHWWDPNGEPLAVCEIDLRPNG